MATPQISSISLEHLAVPVGSSNPILYTLIFVGFSLLPMVVLSATSFLKISVVLNMLRSAIGAGQIPSGAIISLVSLVLTMHIMSPVAKNSVDEMVKVWQDLQAEQRGSSGKSSSASSTIKSATVKFNTVEFNNLDFKMLLRLVEAGAHPLEDFIRVNTGWKERVFFSALVLEKNNRGKSVAALPSYLMNFSSSSKTAPADVNDTKLLESQVENGDQELAQILAAESLFTLIPAFVISELRAAFMLGFVLFVPFLVLDLIIGNLLAGLGMMMVSPTTISLPFKVILFVACDGWLLLCRSLVLSYGGGG